MVTGQTSCIFHLSHNLYSSQELLCTRMWLRLWLLLWLKLTQSHLNSKTGSQQTCPLFSSEDGSCPLMVAGRYVKPLVCSSQRNTKYHCMHFLQPAPRSLVSPSFNTRTLTEQSSSGAEPVWLLQASRHLAKRGCHPQP